MNISGEINKKIRPYTLTSILGLGVGLAALIPCWDSNTQKYSITEFCFNPPVVYNPQLHQYCTKSKIRSGLSNVVEHERYTNSEFFDKVSLLTKTAGKDERLIYIAGVGCLAIWGAWVAMEAAISITKSMRDDLTRDIILNANRYTTTTANQMSLDNEIEDNHTEQRLDLERRAHQIVLGQNKSADEFQNELLNAKLHNELTDAQHQSNLAQLGKTTAENLRDKAKADKEREKILGKKVEEDTSTPSPNEQLKDQLIEALKSHEDGWLWTLVDAIKPVWLFGDMGTGKTNSGCAIALVRKYCLGIPVHRAADRHLNGENSDVWKLLDATITHDNDSSILEALQMVIERREERINGRVKEPEQFLLDEFTQLAKVDKDTVERFISSTFSDTRKAKEYFIGITHNLTNAAFGEGSAEMRKGAFYLQKFTLDNKKPLPRIVVKTGLKDDKGNNLEDVEKTLPKWFEAFRIYNHFNGSPIKFDS